MEEAKERAEIVRTPAMIAGEINYIKQKASETMISYCIEIGQRLTEAKDLVPYGEWTNWLRENVDYSVAKAEQLMRVAEEYGDEQINMITGKSKSETFRNIGFSQALALLALPEPDRAEYVETHDMESISVRELQEEIKTIKAERDAAVKQKQEAEDTAKKANADAADALAKGAKHAAEKSVEEQKRKDAERDLKAAETKVKEMSEVLEAARQEASEARERIAELEAQEQEEPETQQPTMETAVSEEAIETEREKIREEYAHKLSIAANEHLHAFKFAMEAWQTYFKRMENEIRFLDPDTRIKLRGKVAATADLMREKMEDGGDDLEADG